MTSAITKIDVDLKEEYAPKFYALCEALGVKRPQHLFEESFHLFTRCIAEVQQGRRIASIQTDGGKIIASIDENDEIANVLLTRQMLEDISAKYAA